MTSRPKCFEFAMSFLGSPEAEEMHTYIESLEKEIQQFHPVGRVEKHTGSLKDMAIIVWKGWQPEEGTVLYTKEPV